MESSISFEEHAPMSPFLDYIAQDCSRIVTDQDIYEPSLHPLRSHSRRQRNAQISQRAALLDRLATDDALQTQPRLRRIQAFPDLLESDSPSFSPLVSVSVAKEGWLEESVAKAKNILTDKESAEDMAHQMRGVVSIECLDAFAIKAGSSSFGRRGSQLHHKDKSQDLRSDYASDDFEAYYGPLAAPPPYLSDGSTSSYSCEDSATSSSDTVSSDTGYSTHDQEDLYCVCRRAFDASLGDMVACVVCKEWFYMGCVVQGYRFAKEFSEVFYCPECEELAIRVIVEEEEANREFLQLVHGNGPDFERV